MFQARCPLIAFTISVHHPSPPAIPAPAIIFWDLPTDNCSPFLENRKYLGVNNLIKQTGKFSMRVLNQAIVDTLPEITHLFWFLPYSVTNFSRSTYLINLKSINQYLTVCFWIHDLRHYFLPLSLIPSGSSSLHSFVTFSFSVQHMNARVPQHLIAGTFLIVLYTLSLGNAIYSYS